MREERPELTAVPTAGQLCLICGRPVELHDITGQESGVLGVRCPTDEEEAH
jgi:hypothetical protein